MLKLFTEVFVRSLPSLGFRVQIQGAISLLCANLSCQLVCIDLRRSQQELLFFLQASAQRPESPSHKLACYLEVPRPSSVAAQPRKYFLKRRGHDRKAQVTVGIGVVGAFPWTV